MFVFSSKFFLNKSGFPTTRNTTIFNMFKHLIQILPGQYHLEINNKNLPSNKQADI
ncbi:DUF2498 family protein [Photorhabdus asymbiotica]|uniref:DUF2498 family protein n=1 Tax=Photorhabdus asymbiotica TaxID=291112 RepID=UPI003DA77606